jgi:hypothetical protein
MANPARTSHLLVLALFLSVGLAVILCYRHVEGFRRVGDLQVRASRLQVQTVLVNRNRGALQALAKEVAEYAQRTPGLQGFVQQYTPLYQQLNLLPGAGSAAANPAQR